MYVLRFAFVALLFVALRPLSAWGSEDAVAAAKKYAGLAAQADSAGAYQMLAPRARAMPRPEFEKLLRFQFHPGGGVLQAALGPVLYSAEGEKAALVLFSRRFQFDPKQVADARRKFEAGLGEDFPPAQLAAARRHIRLEGNEWIAFWPVYLVREIKAKTTYTDEGEPMETLRTPGPWMVDPKGETFPFREFRPGLLKKFGANLLRYGGEDTGDPGCYDPKNSEGRCYEGESPKAASPAASAGGGCFLVELKKPCDPDMGCFFTGGDEPVPCKKGQGDCWTADGEACAIR